MVKILSKQREVLTSGRQQDLGAVISSRDGKRGETDAREGKPGEKVCKVCESDRRTVTHLMKEHAGRATREGGEKKGKRCWALRTTS